MKPILNSIKDLESIISKYNLDISIDFFDNLDKYDWQRISIYFTLPAHFIIKHKDQLSWIHICQNQILSENLITQIALNTNYLSSQCWNYISSNPLNNLSESFISNFNRHINYHLIAKYQNISLDFILNNFYKFKDSLSMLQSNQNLSYESKNTINTLFNLYTIQSNYQLSKQHIINLLKYL